MAQHRLARCKEMFAQAQRSFVRCPGEQARQPLLAGKERVAAQVVAIEKEQVEGEEDELFGLPLRQGRLKRRE